MERTEIPKPVHVLLVEDSAIVREAIASEFQADPRFEVVGQAASLAEARELLAQADVAILDLGLPDGSGADLIPELRRANPNARAIVLSTTYDRSLHLGAIEHGAEAVLDKLAHLGQVTQAVWQILSGP
jgi:DNA-binding NarL/FixJ family response regulator